MLEHCLTYCGSFINIESILSIFDRVLNITAYVIAILGMLLGLKVLNEFEKKQNSAMWNYHTNISVFLTILKNITFKDKDPTPVTKYFRESLSDENNKSTIQSEIDNFRHFAQEFIHYLSTASEQIPPTKKLSEWEKDKKTLILFLQDAVFLGKRINGLNEAELQEMLKNIFDTIDRIENVINIQKKELERKLQSFFIRFILFIKNKK